MFKNAFTRFWQLAGSGKEIMRNRELRIYLVISFVFFKAIAIIIFLIVK